MIDTFLTRNGVNIHIIDQERIDQCMYPQQVQEACYPIDNVFISTRLSLALIAQFVIGYSISFDYAMPIPYQDGCVWIYDEQAPIFGRLYNVQEEFNKIVREFIKSF